MNVLVVHEVDWLKKVVFEIHNISEQLSLLGHQITAIDYEDQWQWHGFLDFLKLKTTEFGNISRTVTGGSVFLSRPGFIRIPGISRLSAGLTHYLEIERLIKERKIEIILLYSVPTNGLQTIHLAKKYNIPVVFRSIDILHRMVRYPMLRLLVKSMEKKVYLGADKILANSPSYARYILDMGVPESKVKLVPMPIDTGLFIPGEESKELCPQWGLNEQDKVVLFIGTLFKFSGLDDFINQFPRIIAEVPETKLLIVGDGPQRSKLERIIDRLGLRGKVIITGFQPYSSMPSYISIATVCINTFTNTKKNEDILPGKILQYLACGKAVVATPLLGITSFITDETGSIVYAEGEEMTKQVVSLLGSPERRAQMGQLGIKYVRENHSYDSIVPVIEAELTESLKRKSDNGNAQNK